MANLICPTTHNPADAPGDDRLTGCGGIVSGEPDSEGWMDCPHCGLAFHRREAAPATPGQAAYEAERASWPRYHDGTFRPAWGALPDYARASWERDPTSRGVPPFALADAGVS